MLDYSNVLNIWVQHSLSSLLLAWFLMAPSFLQGWENFGSFYPYPKDKCTGNEVDYHDNPERCFSFIPVNKFI